MEDFSPPFFMHLPLCGHSLSNLTCKSPFLIFFSFPFFVNNASICAETCDKLRHKLIINSYLIMWKKPLGNFFQLHLSIYIFCALIVLIYCILSLTGWNEEIGSKNMGDISFCDRCLQSLPVLWEGQRFFICCSSENFPYGYIYNRNHTLL